MRAHTAASQPPILVAISDAALHTEAVHLAAATGRQVIDAAAEAHPAALARHADTAYAILIDAASSAPRRPRPGVFLVAGSVETIDAELAVCPQAQEGFVLPEQAAGLLRALGSLAQPPQVGRVLSVVGTAGGAGASTLGACLCRSAAADREPALVDAHRYSGGIDLLLGIEAAVGARWGEIVIGEGTIERAGLRHALPSTPDRIAVLTSSRTTINDPFVLDAGMLERAAEALGADGLTVVDCPVSLVPQRSDVAVLVVPAEVRAAASAARIASELAAKSLDVALVVRRRAWSGLSTAEVERVAKEPVVAELPEIAGLTRQVETAGLPIRLPRPLARAAEAVLAEVG
ncbi:septum site-determining protein Ssd [Corynebacterium liangguodongii]|uniref:Rv3660c-like CheY-like N-terminal domain-containing protein n=1 Tax=Corynebacterium liangguodongii TaxID=2079535 RepID=A0A2S0WBT7_9CORY|nr:septum site-determining protein Ssd [Corynebacterium liangguodongii]AWB83227.1 hypothetical protein C3E79_00960 [Corynebacterium liangguodongii]PWB98676.1 hypothetical protein DF219_10650 [Corynebacterium liangguodongii]